MEGDPVGKSRPRFSRFGHAYTDSKTRLAEDKIKSAIRNKLSSDFKLLTGALELQVSFFIRPPLKLKNNFPITRPDVDNYLKLVMDAMNELVYKDDSQIVRVICLKNYALHDLPYTMIKLTEVE